LASTFAAQNRLQLGLQGCRFCKQMQSKCKANAKQMQSKMVCFAAVGLRRATQTKNPSTVPGQTGARRRSACYSALKASDLAGGVGGARRRCASYPPLLASDLAGGAGDLQGSSGGSGAN
jgi:hypothetical protein